MLIAGTAADISGKGMAYLLFTRIRRILQKGDQCKNDPRCTKAALQAMRLNEAFLNGVQIIDSPYTFDSDDLMPIGLYCEHKAGSDRLPVE